jgi:hypothetical protein
MTIIKRALLLILILQPLSALAHEVRPAYLELREVEAGLFSVLWKTPMRGDMRLSLSPEFSGDSKMLAPALMRDGGGAAIQTWKFQAQEPVRGQTLRIRGLEQTMTDTLARIEFIDGSIWLKRLTPQVPDATIPLRPSPWSVVSQYLGLGFEHILFGIDHLLFVLALLLIVDGRWLLLKTVTAFTLAHSITLAFATMGGARLPSAPVEAVIALSIVFVASEIVREGKGERGLTTRAPWLVAFIFGLLHGFGFAGALAEVGLPDGHIPTALLFFNIGVELGQLAFIVIVLAAGAAIRRFSARLPRWALLFPPYAIGGTATFWLIERVAAF